MQRALLLLLISVIAAIGIFYGLRLAERTSSAPVASLLPRETVALAHLPDFNGMLQQWHRSDIYQIYREPAVREFLQKPSSRASRNQVVANTLQEIKELDPKDSFLALTSAVSDKPKIIAGFRFRCSQDAADRIMESWRAKIKAGKREDVAYQQHEITVFSEAAYSIALVQDRHWFFASNDLDELKAVLDRADGRMTDQQLLLAADESYREAMSTMPSSYAFLLYLQPKTFGDRLASLRAALGTTAKADQRPLLEQIHSICATTRFDRGKMHDVIFIGMPKQEQDGELTRTSLTLGTRATFLYMASMLNFAKQVALFSPGAGANFLGTGLQKMANALAVSGITPKDWDSAFDPEAGILADWPQDVHWPSIIASCGVKDETRAKKIIGALTHGIDEDGRWNEAEIEGIHYWSITTTPSLLPIRPVIGLSNRLLVAGLDTVSVQAAMRRYAKGASELANTDTYKRAVRAVPAPTNFFAYVDTGLLYSRLDATLRPMLFMGAAFIPSINDYIDLAKLPAPEVITKHLSPIVSSQRYVGKGYVAESVGPITLNQSGVGLGLLAGFGALGYQRSSAAGWGQFGLPSPQPSPSETP